MPQQVTSGRRAHLAAVARQHFDGGGAAVGEHQALDAAQEEAHACRLRSPWAGVISGSDVAQRAGGQRRQHPLHVAELRRQRPVEPGRMEELLQAEPLVQADRQRGPAPSPGCGRTGRRKIGRFHQLGLYCSMSPRVSSTRSAGLMPDRADRVAGQAGHALVHLVLQIRARLQLALDHLANQGDAAARRLRFSQMLAIDGTGGQTQATANAVQVLLFGGHLQTGEPVRRPLFTMWTSWHETASRTA